MFSIRLRRLRKYEKLAKRFLKSESAQPQSTVAGNKKSKKKVYELPSSIVYCFWVQGWARFDFFKIVPFHSRTIQLDFLVPFFQWFRSRSVLSRRTVIPFRSVLGVLSQRTVPSLSFRSQSRTFPSPVPFLEKNNSIQDKSFIEKSWLKSKK